MVDDFKPVVTDVPSVPVPVDPPKKVEPVVKSARDRVLSLLENGGEMSCDCSVEEFQSIFEEFRPQRRSCVLGVNWVDGVLHASARL